MPKLLIIGKVKITNVFEYTTDENHKEEKRENSKIMVKALQKCSATTAAAKTEHYDIKDQC
jgi:hypothetical protein